MRRYTVLLYSEPDEEGYIGVVPILPGCVAEGETVDETLANIRAAIEDYLRTSAALGEDVPDEPIPPAVVTVEIADEQTSAAERLIWPIT